MYNRKSQKTFSDKTQSLEGENFFMLTTLSATVMSSFQQPQFQLPGWAYVLYAVIGIVALIAECKLYAMAGEPAWAAIIPIYNLYVFFKIIYVL